MMKQGFAYLKLGFYGLLFAFLIWGLINIVSTFSIQIDGWITFLSVVVPNAIALGFIGFRLVVAILAVKTKPTPKPQPPLPPTP
jgi:hypothetical protein